MTFSNGVHKFKNKEILFLALFQVHNYLVMRSIGGTKFI